METQYKTVNGTSYKESTPDAVIAILERSRQSSKTLRLKLFYGDVKTGKAWLTEEDYKLYGVESAGDVGYVGRSTGTHKVPLAIFSTYSKGGEAILDNCIVRIETSRKANVLYTHPAFHFGVAE